MVGLFIFLMVGLFTSIVLEMKSNSGRRIASFEMSSSYGDDTINFNILSKNIKLLNEKVDTILKLQKDKELINLVAETNIKSKGLLELLNKLSYDSLSYYNALASTKKSGSDGEKIMAKMDEILRLLKGQDSYLEDRAAAIRSSMDRINDEDVEKSVESDKQLLENQVSRREFDEEMDEFVKDRGVRKALVGLRRNIESYDKEVPMEEIISAKKDNGVLGVEETKQLKESIDSIDNLDDFPPLEPEVPNIAENEEIKLLKGITSIPSDAEDVSTGGLEATNNEETTAMEVSATDNNERDTSADVDFAGEADNSFASTNVEDEVNDALKLDDSGETTANTAFADFNLEEDANMLTSGMEMEEEVEGLNLDAAAEDELGPTEPEIDIEDADEEEENVDLNNGGMLMDSGEGIESDLEEEVGTDIATDEVTNREEAMDNDDAMLREEEGADYNEVGELETIQENASEDMEANDNIEAEDDSYYDDETAMAEEEIDDVVDETVDEATTEKTEDTSVEAVEENLPVENMPEGVSTEAVPEENIEDISTEPNDYEDGYSTEENDDSYDDYNNEEDYAIEEDSENPDDVGEEVKTEESSTTPDEEDSAKEDDYDDDFDDRNDGYEEEIPASSEGILDNTAEENAGGAIEDNEALIQKNDTTDYEEDEDSYDDYEDEEGYREDLENEYVEEDEDGSVEDMEEESNDYGDADNTSYEETTENDVAEPEEDVVPKPATEFNIKDSINKLKERLKIGAEAQ